MTIKKYRIYLFVGLLVVVLLGAFVLVQSAEKDETYKDGIMVYEECICDKEEYL